eukprot:1332888-Rhodomonas_salina.1
MLLLRTCSRRADWTRLHASAQPDLRWSCASVGAASVARSCIDDDQEWSQSYCAEPRQSVIRTVSGWSPLASPLPGLTRHVGSNRCQNGSPIWRRQTSWICTASCPVELCSSVHTSCANLSQSTPLRSAGTREGPPRPRNGLEAG